MARAINQQSIRRTVPGFGPAGKRRRGTLRLGAVLTVVMVTGCATTGQNTRLPPVPSNPGGEVEAGKLVWIDLLTEDVRAAAAFYGGLFGWHAVPSEEEPSYYLFRKGNRPIAGMVAVDGEDASAPESLWLVSMSVDHVNRSVATVREQGGELLEGPVYAAGRGWMALVSDPAGASLILLRATGGDPADREAEIGEWLWTDLFTRDAGRAGEFYSSLAGYRRARVEAGDDHRYDLLTKNGRALAGMVELDWEGLEDNWLPYFRVADIDAAVEKARELGGGLILKTGRVAILTDPTGAAFGIQARP